MDYTEQLLKPFPTPGIYHNVADEVYHKWGGASFSRLSKLDGRSPAHLLESILNPRPATPALKLGRFYHAAVLEPEKFDVLFVSKGDIDRRTSAGKNAFAELQLKHHPDNILDAKDFDICLRIRDAASKHPTVSTILKSSKHKELSFAYVDSETGIPCRGRVDAFCEGLNATIDIKGTECAERGEFVRTIFDYGYHVQGAHYVDAMNLFERTTTDHIIIAIEKKPHHGISVFRLTPRTLDLGRRKFRILLNQFAECIKSNSFPGYPTDIRDLELEEWMIKRAEKAFSIREEL